MLSINTHIAFVIVRITVNQDTACKTKSKTKESIVQCTSFPGYDKIRLIILSYPLKMFKASSYPIHYILYIYHIIYFSSKGSFVACTTCHC